MKDDECSVRWRFVAELHPRRSPFTTLGLTVAAIFGAARRLASRAVCSGQTSVSSHATCVSSEASIGLRSNPARQTTCGKAVGNGVVSLARHRKTGGSKAIAGARPSPGSDIWIWLTF